MTDPYIAALIDLHRGLHRQGPGDAEFSRQILAQLPPLPPNPGIADLGCGSGAGTLLLAQFYQSKLGPCPVSAVDLCADFLQDLQTQAIQAGLADWIRPIQADMGQLDWPRASLDLIWSEGAAYNLGFERALQLWHPLLCPQGLVVVSELSWFGESIPAEAIAYWQPVYPGMGSEAENSERAQRAGFQVLDIQRLPSEAWWANYYGPLRQRMAQFESTPTHAAVLAETEAEMALFEQFSDVYGYSFYILQALNGQNESPFISPQPD